ncbi:MAG: hypothetical protein AAGJ80_05865, partial [Cyanobacteria bacterium J06553_1]
MRGLISLAELFILVAILFLIQTVINFASQLNDSATRVEDYAVLSISQVPSGGHFVDHIRSIQIRDVILVLKPGGCRTLQGALPKHPAEPGTFRSSELESCKEHENSVLRELDGTDPTDLVEFIKYARLWNIDIAFSET